MKHRFQISFRKRVFITSNVGNFISFPEWGINFSLWFVKCSKIDHAFKFFFYFYSKRWFTIQRFTSSVLRFLQQFFNIFPTRKFYNKWKLIQSAMRQFSFFLNLNHITYKCFGKRALLQLRLKSRLISPESFIEVYNWFFIFISHLPWTFPRKLEDLGNLVELFTQHLTKLFSLKFVT